MENKKKKVRRYLKDQIELLKKIIKENGGVLPHVQWLLQNEHAGLYQYIRKYPKKFKGIKQVCYKNTKNGRIKSFKVIGE